MVFKRPFPFLCLLFLLSLALGLIPACGGGASSAISGGSGGGGGEGGGGGGGGAHSPPNPLCFFAPGGAPPRFWVGSPNRLGPFLRGNAAPPGLRVFLFLPPPLPRRI